MRCDTGVDYIYTDTLFYGCSGYLLIFQTLAGGLVREISEPRVDVAVCPALWQEDRHGIFRRCPA